MITRRIFTASLGAFTLAGCTSRIASPQVSAIEPVMLMPDAPEPFPIEAVDLTKIDRQFWRQVVPNPTGEPVGTIVVDPEAKFLWLVIEGDQAVRYGIGVGRQGFGWSGRADILRRAAWPKWTPPAEMIGRQPELQQWAGGMPGGPDNPLGARALYLYQNKVDTLYRIHGTGEPWSIGRAVSSGCIRLLHVDIIDLHRRVPIGTKVLVRTSSAGAIS